MALNPHIGTTQADAALTTLLPLQGGTLTIYSGTQPASPNSTPATTYGSALATLTFSSAFTVAANVATAGTIATSGSAVGGTASWFRAYDSAGTARLDGSVGVGTSFDLNISSVTISTNDTVSCSSMTVTLAS